MFALVFAFVFSILMGVCVNAMANADANFHLFVIVKVCWCLVIFCFSSTLSTKFAFVFQIFALYFTNQIYFFSLLFSFYLVAPFFFCFFGTFGLAIFFRLMVVCIRRNQRRKMLYLSLSVFELISFAPL